MILWMVKLFSGIRRAVAGRKYPSQLAWAVSFGVLLGAVPHGNLLALAILIVVLSLRINHAMAGLTAVAVSFLATRLDPYSHQLGAWVLSHSMVQEKAMAAWQLPLMPWTDLNNTVVMGSFLIGVALLVPMFCISYPIFKLLAPRADLEASQAQGTSSVTGKQVEAIHQVVLIDPGHQTISDLHIRPKSHLPIGSGDESQTELGSSAAIASDTETTLISEIEIESVPEISIDPEVQSIPDKRAVSEAQSISEAESVMEEIDFVEIDHKLSDPNEMLAVETRIDVIRMNDHRDADTKSSTADPSENQAERMDEALNYLLRQLRDSKQRNAA